MKKTIFAFLTMTSLFVFADQPIGVNVMPIAYDSKADLQLKPNLPSEQLLAAQDDFFYVRFTTIDSDLIRDNSILPGLGIGYRRLAGDGAADISISGIGRSEHKNGRFVWTAPKASYFHYLQPNAKQSTYLGGGLAWGGVGSKDQKFIGIIPSATVGHEFSHKGSFLSFAEFTVSQPAVAVYQKGGFPGPSAEVSMGIGF